MRNNIEAIRVAFRLGVEKRPPTAAEREALGRYAGFGGLKCILNDANELADAAKWSKSDIELFAPTVELRRLIHDYSKNDKEFAAYMDSLKASVLTAFYTPEPVIDAIADSLKVNGIEVYSSDDIGKALKDADKDNIELMIIRNGASFTTNAKAELDSISGEYKLGLSVSDATDGIGTLTFVDCADLRYGALGHPISEIYGKDGTTSVSGFICGANVFSVYKGEKNRAGELVGNLIKEVKLGNIDTNEQQGIFGEYTGDLSGMKKISVASSKNVKPGKAQIVTSAFTGKPTYYDIEIIKACKQDKDKPKGILYRVTDQRLIKLCGGIVQGMSGSPIIQKGKLVGAVTHVFLADSTKGYGTYIDWMIDK